MIPKIIHCAWFGEAIPKILYEYIQSWVFHIWKDGFKIMIWDNSNVKLFLTTPITRFLWNNKRYSFLSDYIRCKVLYEYGGIWIDTDVQMYDSFNKILDLNTFIGLESPITDYKVYNPNKQTIDNHKICCAILGTYLHNSLFKEMLEFMEKMPPNNFIFEGNGSSLLILPDIITTYIKNNIPYKIANSIEEAKIIEANKILPIFNYPDFDCYNINNKRDYSICSHRYTNLWTEGLDKIYDSSFI